MLFQLEVYYKVDRLLTGLTDQQKGTTARWYSNKTSLYIIHIRKEGRVRFNLILLSKCKAGFQLNITEICVSLQYCNDIDT